MGLRVSHTKRYHETAIRLEWTQLFNDIPPPLHSAVLSEWPSSYMQLQSHKMAAAPPAFIPGRGEGEGLSFKKALTFLFRKWCLSSFHWLTLCHEATQSHPTGVQLRRRSRWILGGHKTSSSSHLLMLAVRPPQGALPSFTASSPQVPSSLLRPQSPPRWPSALTSPHAPGSPAEAGSPTGLLARLVSLYLRWVFPASAPGGPPQL